MNQRNLPRRKWADRFCGALAGLLVSLGALTGCDGSSGERTNSDNANAEAEFVFANRGEVTMLDPNQMSWMQDIRIGQGLFEGAYMLQAETLKPQLGAAEQVTQSDDYKTWTIKVRQGAKWSNGDAVGPDDFIFAWRRHMREEGPYSYLVNEYIEARRPMPISTRMTRQGQTFPRSACGRSMTRQLR